MFAKQIIRPLAAFTDLDEKAQTKEKFLTLYSEALKKGDYRQLYHFAQASITTTCDDGECLWMTARANRLYAYNHIDITSEKNRLITEGYRA